MKAFGFIASSSEQVFCKDRALCRKALAGYVLAPAQDGYQVLFSLAELHPSLMDNQILLADTTAIGKLLFGAHGRLRLANPERG